MGFHGFSFLPLTLRHDYAHSFYLALTRLWAIYHLSPYSHFTVFTLHVMIHSMLLPCNCDPCLHLHVVHYSTTSMCICILGGDTCCYCLTICVPHANCYCYEFLVHHAIVPSCVGRVMICHCHLHRTSSQFNDHTLLISCFHACDMSCALFKPTLCTHDMIAMITSSMLHLCTTSRHT